MSNLLAVPPAARNAMLEGYAAWLNEGDGDPVVILFDITRPSNGATVVESPMVSIPLANPCGEIVGNKLKLIMKNPTGAQATVSGAPAWGRVVTASGLWAGDGDAGAEGSDTVFQVISDDGEFRAGGYVLLSNATLG